MASPRAGSLPQIPVVVLALAWACILGLPPSAGAVPIVSAGSGPWHLPGTWTGGFLPGPGDDVTIADGTTVTVVQDASCASLAVGQGVSGTLQVDAGVLEVGAVAGAELACASGAALIVNGGTIEVAGRLTGTSGPVTYSQSGGTVLCTTVGNGELNRAGFDLGNAAIFTMSGGTIALELAGTAVGRRHDYRNLADSVNISGGTVRLGTPASGPAQTFWIEGVAPNLRVLGEHAGHTARLYGSISVHLTTTIDSTTTLMLDGAFLNQLGPLLVNHGVINGSAPSSHLYFGGDAPCTYTGRGTVGTGRGSVPLQGMTLDNPGGLTIDPASAGITTLRLRLYDGMLTHAHKLTIGIGGTSSSSIQFGAPNAQHPGGSLDGPPVFDIGSQGYLLLYEGEAQGRVTGVEVPPGRSVFYLEVNNPFGITLAGGDLTATGQVNLLKGTFTTGADTLRVDAAASVSRSTGHVVGNLQKIVTAGATVTRTFEIGGPGSYAPINLSFTNVVSPGSLTASTVDADHPALVGSGIEPARSVNRTWKLIGPRVLFTSYAATFNFTVADLDPGALTSSFRIRRWDGVVWSPTSIVTRTATGTRASGITAFGEFAVGEPVANQVVVVQPNGGETLVIGTIEKLVWVTSGPNPVNSVDLLLSRNSGQSFSPLVTLTGDGGGLYRWTVTGPGTNTGGDTVFTALLRVVVHDSEGGVASDTSDALFAIHDPTTGVLLVQLEALAGDDGVTVRWELAEPESWRELRLQRAGSEAGPWTEVNATPEERHGATVVIDRDALPGRTCFYRLVATTLAGERRVFGPTRATVASAPREFALHSISPNPSRGAARIAFSVPESGPIALEVLDVQGRRVATLVEGSARPGRYEAVWDGAIGSGPAPAGVYLVRYRSAGQETTRRIVRIE